MYGQFRRRYDANLEVIDRYEVSGVPVEVISSVTMCVYAHTVYMYVTVYAIHSRGGVRNYILELHYVLLPKYIHMDVIC